MGRSFESNHLVKGLLLGSLVGGVAWLLGGGDRSPRSYFQESNSNVTAIVAGTLLGAVIGVVAGLLLAPESGAELRQELGDKYDEIREKAEKFLKDVNKKGHEAAEKASGNLEDWKDNLSTLVNKLSSDKVKSQASATLNEVADWAHIGLRLWNKLHDRR